MYIIYILKLKIIPNLFEMWLSIAHLHSKILMNLQINVQSRKQPKELYIKWIKHFRLINKQPEKIQEMCTINLHTRTMKTLECYNRVRSAVFYHVK